MKNTKKRINLLTMGQSIERMGSWGSDKSQIYIKANESLNGSSIKSPKSSKSVDSQELAQALDETKLQFRVPLLQAEINNARNNALDSEELPNS